MRYCLWRPQCKPFTLVLCEVRMREVVNVIRPKCRNQRLRPEKSTAEYALLGDFSARYRASISLMVVDCFVVFPAKVPLSSWTRPRYPMRRPAPWSQTSCFAKENLLCELDTFITSVLPDTSHATSP